jgi:hypothetical protein
MEAVSFFPAFLREKRYSEQQVPIAIGIAPENIYYKKGIFFEGAIKIKYICKN